MVLIRSLCSPSTWRILLTAFGTAVGASARRPQMWSRIASYESTSPARWINSTSTSNGLASRAAGTPAMLSCRIAVLISTPSPIDQMPGWSFAPAAPAATLANDEGAVTATTPDPETYSRLPPGSFLSAGALPARHLLRAGSVSVLEFGRRSGGRCRGSRRVSKRKIAYLARNERANGPALQVQDSFFACRRFRRSPSLSERRSETYGEGADKVSSVPHFFFTDS